MHIDVGRQQDLEELAEAYDRAPNSYWRDQYTAKMDGIMRESGQIRSVREDLIKAVRHNDRRAIKYLNEKIRRIRLEETYGRRDH